MLFELKRLRMRAQGYFSDLLASVSNSPSPPAPKPTYTWCRDES